MPLVPLNKSYVDDNNVDEYDVIFKFIVLPLLGLFSIFIIYINKITKQKYL